MSFDAHPAFFYLTENYSTGSTHFRIETAWFK